MSVEITDNAIRTVADVAGVLPDQAAGLLRSHNGNVEQAINAHFENPSALQAAQTNVGSWDEDPGPIPGYPYPNQGVPTFQIDATDSGETQNMAGIPPSRPNSRMSHRSHRDTIDLTPEHAAGETPRQITKRIKLNPPDPKADPSKSMSAEQRYDYDMRMAIDMSLGNPEQENGITTSIEQQFGPANRDYYENEAWALATTNTITQEIILQPEPKDRARVEGEPAFLRPSEKTGYLSALLTILHAIPLAREALLFRSDPLEDYGHDAEWWNGVPITLSKVVSMEEGQWQPTGSDDEVDRQRPTTRDESYLEIIRELQRLMAFLDLTKRAYGSTDALATHDRIRAMGDPNSMVVHFLESWQKAHAVQPVLQNIFATRATKRNQVDGALQEETCLLLEVDVEAEHGQTLYDVVDRVIWSDQPDQELDEVWFDSAAEVFTMRLRLVGKADTKKGADVKIPAVWYPDRYFKEHLYDAREVREGKLDVLKEIERIDEMIERHSKFQSAPGEIVGVKALLESTTNTIEKSFSDRQVNGTSEDHDMGLGPFVSNSEVTEAIAELKLITDSIGRKLESLQKRKGRAVESLRELTKALTESSSEEGNPRNKYTLRGVSTKPHITYVLRRADFSDESSTDTIDNEWQWWRISFSRDDAKRPSQDVSKSEAAPPEKPASVGWGVPAGPASEWQNVKMKEKPRGSEHLGYAITKVREIEVLKAAREESSTVLLVYASEKAMQQGQSPPDYTLARFVETDNEAFEADLADDGMPPLESSTSSPSSPSKRKRTETSSGYNTNGVDISDHLEPVYPPQQPFATRGFDERIPTSLIDRELGEMTTIDMTDSPPAQEMQEKSGGSLLSGRSTARFGRSNQGSMDRIGEEAGEDDMEISHMEYA